MLHLAQDGLSLKQFNESSRQWPFVDFYSWKVFRDNSEKVCVPVGEFGYIDAACLPSGLCPAGQIDRIAKEAVPWHAGTNDSGHYLTTVDPNGYLGMEREMYT